MTPPVIITGMHRSATSLLASMFHRAGLHLGDRLLMPSRANRPGYFEDRDFIDLHEAFLKHLGTTMYLPTPPRGILGPEHRERAESLLADRRHRPAWGWKDPRTCLFLDFWHQLAPDARFVFVVRRPAEVADSLRRRGDAEVHLQYRGAPFLARLGVPRFRLRRAMDLWARYNACIADFAEANRDRCHVIRSTDLATGAARIIRAVAATGVPLRTDVAPAEMIQEHLLTRRPPRLIEWACERSRPVRTLMHRLEALADADDAHGPHG
jgi:hypothetical protein